MSTSNAVAIALACRDPADADLLPRAAERLVAAGAQAGPANDDSALLHRFDGHTGAMLMEAARLLRTAPFRGLGGGAVVAVKVVNGVGLKPSEQTATIARTLAREAPPGRLALSLRLGSLLGLTEAALSSVLRPINLPTAGGTKRAAMLLDVDGTAPATLTPVNGASSLVALDAARRARLVDQLSARLLDDLGPIASILVAQVFEESDTSADLVKGLAPYLSARGAARLEAVVAEEVRLVFLRGR